MIRLAPSLGTGLAADLGARDLLNRAQLLLQNCYVNISASGARGLLQGIVNPVNIAAANWQNVNSQGINYAPSFAQFVANTTIVPGFPAAASTLYGKNTNEGGINSHLTQIQWAQKIGRAHV